MKKIFLFATAVCVYSACTPGAKVVVTPTSGYANFNNYLSIGSGYTAGAADSTLYVSAQVNSYPAMLFQQFAEVPASNGTRGSFIQPLLDGDDGYPGPKFILGETYVTCDSADSSLGPVSYPNYIQDAKDAQVYVSPINNGQINNIGVPGLRVADLPVASFAGFNPYAARFFVSTTETPYDEIKYRVANLHPNFFTMWLGMEDVLGYAMAGGQGNGTGSAVPLTLNYYSTIDITPTAVFEKLYDSALNAAILTGAGGALISIPDVDSMPFFTVIPANGLVISRQSWADSLQNVIWSGVNWNKVFQLGNNYFIIQDNNGNTRQAVPGERILLTTGMTNIICNGWGSVTPIPKQYVLTTDELQNLRAATQTFNAFIQQEAILHNLAYVNINSFMAQLYSGYNYNGINYNMNFISGGAFSLDGINFTPRGYALIADQIMNAINTTYHSSLQPLNVNQYNGIVYP